MKNYQGGLIDRLLLFINSGDETQNNADSLLANQIKDFIDELPGGFLVYSADEAEKILYANKALLSIFGCKTFQEFLALTGNSFRGVVHPDDLEEVEASITEQISQSPDDLDYVEYRIIRKDGAIRRVEDYGHFARTESGDIFYVFISDATEKINKRLQERLQRLEIIEGLSVNYESILYFDLDNDTVQPYRLSSRTKEQFRGNWGVKGYNEIIKDYIAQWVHPDDRASVTERLSPAYMDKVLAETTTYYFNYRCIQNGETIHLQLRIVNVGKKNTVSKFVLGFRRIDEEILREITQKQILEDALKASKLAEVAKNTFLANMSHDMRTPLNAIFGFSALARKNLDNAESIEYYLDRIDEAGKQILELTAKVLETSETKTQDFIIKETPCDLVALLEEIYEATKAQALKKNLHVVLNTQAIEHRNVLADSDKIRNILWYLIVNAVNFNKLNGSIEIIVTERPHGDGRLRNYSFAVKDTGIGISPDALERIFAPFEREKDTTESGIGGAGLGLTLARHNAEKMGGTISVESVKGAGSTFTLALNLKLSETDGGDGGEVQAEDLRGLRILLVEDNEINMEIATDILECAGFIVDTATNGQIAVDKVRDAADDAYDVILMDIQMPVMDGRQAATIIRTMGGWRERIPIIALSANAFERDKTLSLEHSMDAHLTKPMDLELIIKTITEILNNKRK